MFLRVETEIETPTTTWWAWPFPSLPDAYSGWGTLGWWCFGSTLYSTSCYQILACSSWERWLLQDQFDYACWGTSKRCSKDDVPSEKSRESRTFIVEVSRFSPWWHPTFFGRLGVSGVSRFFLLLLWAETMTTAKGILLTCDSLLQDSASSGIQICRGCSAS